MDDAEAQIRQALDHVLDGQPLTQIGHHRWEQLGYRPLRPELIDRACWLHAEGMSLYQIAKQLGMSSNTVKRYIEVAEPGLLTINGRSNRKRAGCHGKLSDEALRILNRQHHAGRSVRDLARLIWVRAGYASPEAARSAIRHHWRRLGLSSTGIRRYRKGKPSQDLADLSTSVPGSCSVTHISQARASDSSTSNEEAKPEVPVRAPAQAA